MLFYKTSVYTSYKQGTVLIAPGACHPNLFLHWKRFFSTMGSKIPKFIKKSLPTHYFLINFWLPYRYGLSMHVLNTKDRKTLRKVLSKFSSMRDKRRKKTWKIAKYIQFLAVLTQDFFWLQTIKVYNLRNEVTVDFTSSLIYKFLLQSAYFIYKREDQEGGRNFFFFFLQEICHVSQSPSSSSFSATQLSSLIERSDFKRCSLNLTYSSTLGVPLGVTPFFFCSRFWTFRDFTTFILTSKTSWMAFRKQWKL